MNCRLALVGAVALMLLLGGMALPAQHAARERELTAITVHGPAVVLAALLEVLQDLDSVVVVPQFRTRVRPPVSPRAKPAAQTLAAVRTTGVLKCGIT